MSVQIPGWRGWLGAIALCLIAASILIGWRCSVDITAAAARATRGGVLIETRCGPIEYQEAGAGRPLLVVHGSGGGHDQGMAFAGALGSQGLRVIAPSRFGYLRTPMPLDASPAAQAEAHVCLLDALGIDQTAVLGGSAGSLSAMQMAIRHPERVSALVLLVPVSFRPDAVAPSAPPFTPGVERLLIRLVTSDFLFWSALHVARDQVIKLVLATPPEVLAAASPQEQARVNAMLDNILPVSTRAEGLRVDHWQATHLEPMALEVIRAPTLLISLRDDGYGTYAGAQYSATRIPGARFIGFDHGGHTWVGHDAEIQSEIASFLGQATLL